MRNGALRCLLLAAVVTLAAGRQANAGGDWVVGWGREDFIRKIKEGRGRNLIPAVIDSFVESGEVRFNAVWKEETGNTDWVVGWSREDFEQKVGANWSKGWKPVVIDNYVLNGAVRFSGVFREGGSDGDWCIAWKREDFERKVVENRGKGWQPIVIDSHLLGGEVLFSAVFQAGTPGAAWDWVVAWSQADFVQHVETLWQKGWSPIVLDSYVLQDGARFTAVFQEGNVSSARVVGMDRAEFVERNQAYCSQDWDPVLLDSYVAGGAVRLSAVWRARGELVGDCVYLDWLPKTRNVPYGAVGYISNGCTGVLIDSEHVLTAAHCIVNEGAASAYYPNLYFYPNFHRGDKLPRRFRIDRAVTGSHGSTGGTYATSDWAIAHLAQPAVGYPSVPLGIDVSPGMKAMVGHYTRDSRLQVPNRAPSEHRDEYGLGPGSRTKFENTWWPNGFISAGRVHHDPANDYSTVFGASGHGGASGSPHMVRDPSGSWRVVGVTHGASCESVRGPWAGRFLGVPRFAQEVAVGTSMWAPNRTGVFVLDADTNRVVSRVRSGDTVLAPFAYYQPLAQLGSRCVHIAALAQRVTGRPGLVVLRSSGELLAADYAGAHWPALKPLNAPPGGAPIDLDVAYDRGGYAVLYAVILAPRPSLVRRKRIPLAAGEIWDARWETVIENTRPRSYTRVTALRHHADGLNQVWMLTAPGDIWTVTEAAPGMWTPVSAFGLPALHAGERLLDIDAAWNHEQHALLVAVTSEGRAWVRDARSAGSGTSWSGWALLPGDVDLGHEGVGSLVSVSRGDARLVSVTAGRWRETQGIVGGADIVPVVFATDTWGNVYQTTSRYEEVPGVPTTTKGVFWSRWMPFCGKRVDPVQSTQD